MRILVDEMPETICSCPYYKEIEPEVHCCTKSSDEYIIPCFRDPHSCPYFVAFDDMFRDRISNYDVQERDPYRWG